MGLVSSVLTVSDRCYLSDLLSTLRKLSSEVYDLSLLLEVILFNGHSINCIARPTGHREGEVARWGAEGHGLGD